MFANLTWRVGAIAATILAALFFVAAATQTIRIEGFRVWPINIAGFKDKNAVLRIDLDALKAGQETARLKIAEAKAQAEAEYRVKAERIDDEYQSQLADANARADAYAKRMRVKAPAGVRSGPVAATSGDPTESLDRSGEDADYIAVSPGDYDIMIENTLRLVKAHEWALGLNQPPAE